MIEVGQSPNGGNINKFISSIDHEGLRGKLLAVNEAKTEGVILSGNTSMDGQVKYGHIYHVKETNPEWYPEVVKEVNSIPNDFLIEF